MRSSDSPAMSAGPLAAEQAAISLLRAFRPLFAEVERAADAFRATLLECDALVSKATNLASRLANASNADTGLGCLVAFPRVRERLVTKQLDQLGLVYGALKIRIEKLATHVSVFERAASDGTQLLENNAYLDASFLALPLAAAAASAQPPATLHAMWLQDLHVWHAREHARRSLALQKFRADFGVSEMRRWSDTFGATCIDRAAIDLVLSRATGRPRFAD